MSCNSENSDYSPVQLLLCEVFSCSFGNVALSAHVVRVSFEDKVPIPNITAVIYYIVTHCFISQ